MEVLLQFLALSVICYDTVTAESNDDNVTLSTVVVSISPSRTYYNIEERKILQITCSANCDPPCQYQWYHQNFQVHGYILNIAVTRDMDYNLYGPLFCLASNAESGPFSSPEIRLYVSNYVELPVNIQPWINIEEGDTLDLCLLDNLHHCASGCSIHLRYPYNQYIYGNCQSIRITRFNSGQWRWSLYYRQYIYYYFTVNVYITPSTHFLIPDIRNLTVDSSRSRVICPIRFDGRCNPNCTYVWYKNDDVFSLGNTLYIDNLNQNDSGSYECKVYNGTEMIDSANIDVMIYGSLAVEPPLRKYELEMGQQFGPILCIASWNNASIYWKTPIGNLYQRDMQIVNLTMEDIGEYCCIGESIFTECIKVARKSTPSENETSLVTDECTERYKLNDHAKHNLTSYVSYSSTQYVEVEVGAPLTLQCTAVCKPVCTRFRWYYADGTLDGQNLYIPYIDETYDYTKGDHTFCLAWDDCFTYHASSNVFINVIYGPKNINFPQVINVEDGSLVNLTINADCNPPCSYKLKYVSMHRSSYVYKNRFQTTVSKESEGIWEWHIHNRYGSVHRHFKVFVWEPHQLIPKDTFYSVDIFSCNKSDIAPIRFIGICNPRCTYVWYRNGVPLSMGNTLLINNYDVSQSGEYHCVGYNEFYNVTSQNITIQLTGYVNWDLTVRDYLLNEGDAFGPINCTNTLMASVKWKTPRGFVYNNTLFITEITSADFGDYACIQDGNENVCRKISLSSVSRNNSERNCDAHLMDFVDTGTSKYSTHINHDMFKNIQTREGSSFTATCFGTCHPECTSFRWYYPGGSSNGQTLRLVDIDSQFHYAIGGQLYCVAWDNCQWPHSSRGIQLHVQYGPNSIAVTPDGDINIEEGSSINLSASADCNPPCSFSLRYLTGLGSTSYAYSNRFQTTVSTKSEGNWQWYISQSTTQVAQKYF